MESVDLNGATENHSKKAKRGRPKKGRSKTDDISGDERAAVRACVAEITKAERKCSTTQVLINFFRSKPASQVSNYRSNANELN